MTFAAAEGESAAMYCKISSRQSRADGVQTTVRFPLSTCAEAPRQRSNSMFGGARVVVDRDLKRHFAFTESHLKNVRYIEILRKLQPPTRPSQAKLSPYTCVFRPDLGADSGGTWAGIPA